MYVLQMYYTRKIFQHHFLQICLNQFVYGPSEFLVNTRGRRLTPRDQKSIELLHYSMTTLISLQNRREQPTSASLALLSSTNKVPGSWTDYRTSVKKGSIPGMGVKPVEPPVVPGSWQRQVLSLRVPYHHRLGAS